MNEPEIIAMARECGATGLKPHRKCLPDDPVVAFRMAPEQLARFAAAVAAKAPGIKTRGIDPPKPWYPDDSGEWEEGHPRDLPPHTEISDFLYAFERKNQEHVALPLACFVHNLTSVDIVAYKVVK